MFTFKAYNLYNFHFLPFININCNVILSRFFLFCQLVVICIFRYVDLDNGLAINTIELNPQDASVVINYFFSGTYITHTQQKDFNFYKKNSKQIRKKTFFFFFFGEKFDLKMLFWIKDFIYVQESLIFYIQYIHTYILTNTNFSIQAEQCITYSNHSRVCVYMLVHDIHSSTLNKL